MIRIAIDGPGGAGKSSVAKRVAKELGIIYVDTGALYRNIGLFVLNKGIDPKDSEGVIGALSEISLELKFSDGKQIILLNGEDMGDKIRTPEVSMAASNISAHRSVREKMVELQRKIASSMSCVIDGRDIGTVVLPDAKFKFFIVADSKIRAERRFLELQSRGQSVDFDTLYKEIVERDKQDSSRAFAPLKQAEDAILVDTSTMTIEEVVACIKSNIQKKI